MQSYASGDMHRAVRLPTLCGLLHVAGTHSRSDQCARKGVRHGVPACPYASSSRMWTRDLGRGFPCHVLVTSIDLHVRRCLRRRAPAAACELKASTACEEEQVLSGDAVVDPLVGSASFHGLSLVSRESLR